VKGSGAPSSLETTLPSLTREYIYAKFQQDKKIFGKSLNAHFKNGGLEEETATPISGP
jgi:hypothetical protein